MEEEGKYDLSLNKEFFEKCKNSFNTNKVADLVKKEELVKLQEKVDLLYGNNLNEVISKFYKFKFPKEPTRVVCLLEDLSEVKAPFYNGKLYSSKLSSSKHDIEVDENGRFMLNIGDSLECTLFCRKISGKILYEVKILNDPKFLKKLLRNYYKFI